MDIFARMQTHFAEIANDGGGRVGVLPGYFQKET